MASCTGVLEKQRQPMGYFREGFWRMMEKECVEVKESRCER